MKKKFTGRPVIPGDVQGTAIVSHKGFNSLASFYKTLIQGAEVAICTDQDNQDLYGKVITDKIICMPKTIGSTSAGAAWDRIAYLGIGPKAMLFSQPIDSLGAASMVIAAIWTENKIITIDQLGQEFLDTVVDGDNILINAEGLVTIGD